MLKIKIIKKRQKKATFTNGNIAEKFTKNRAINSTNEILQTLIVANISKRFSLDFKSITNPSYI